MANNKDSRVELTLDEKKDLITKARKALLGNGTMTHNEKATFMAILRRGLKLKKGPHTPEYNVI